MTTIPKTMRAIVCHAPRDYRLQDHAVVTPGPGEILLRTHTVGICASDLKCYLGAPLFWGDKHRAGYCQTPVIPGHEFVGEVLALGEGAGKKNGLSPGDQVVSEQIIPCQQCRYCRRGQYWMCQVHDICGFRQAAFGAMAEYVLLPSNSLNYKVPTTVPAAHAACIEPLACGIHVLQRGQIELDHVVVIAGTGPLGLGMVAAAKLKNPRLSSRSISMKDAWLSPKLAAPISCSIPPRSTSSTKCANSRKDMAAMSISRPPATPLPLWKVCT